MSARTTNYSAPSVEELSETTVADWNQEPSLELNERQRRQLLVEWNHTASDFPKNRCIHELFAEQAARTPEAVAVVMGDECLTYADLDRRAHHLAHYLRTLGVGPELVVGLCVDRSLAMIVGFLGILKA